MEKSEMRKDIDHILISEEALRERVAQLGEQISADYAGKCPLLVSVLRGSFIFMADLARQVHGSILLRLGHQFFGAGEHCEGPDRIH